MDFFVSYHDQQVDPWVYSKPPQSGRPAEIIVDPVGPNPTKGDPTTSMATPTKPGGLSITLSLDEAEGLAKQLAAVVSEARNGNFTDFGETFAKYHRDQKLKDAWDTLKGDGES